MADTPSSSRLLVRQAFPFWPERAGIVAFFPGFTTMLFAYPNGWYLRLFGEVEGAVRLPFLLHLTVLAAAVVALAEQGRAALTRRAVIAIWISLLAFTLAMAFSATYDPYSADISMPGAQDALLVVCVLGWVHAWLRSEWKWLALFTVLAYTASPNGMQLMGFWLVAAVLVFRPGRGPPLLERGS